MKTCSKCKESKELICFSKNKSRPDGFSYLCKQCSAEKDRKYQQANAEKFAEYYRKYRQANAEKIAKNQRKYEQKQKQEQAANPKGPKLFACMVKGEIEYQAHVEKVMTTLYTRNSFPLYHQSIKLTALQTGFPCHSIPIFGQI